MSTIVPSERSSRPAGPCTRAVRRAEVRPVVAPEPQRTRPEAPSDGWWLQPRPRLLRRLGAASERGTTLVVAPAGSGKSVLVGQWATTARDFRVATVTFDRDDDRGSVGRAIVHALRDLGALGAGGEAAARLEAGGLEAAGSVFATIASLTAPDERPLLVFDGLDAPRSERLRRQLVSLVAQMPPQLRVVVVARARPSLPGPRGVRAVQLGEIELAFTRDEARLLVQGLAGISLSPSQLSRLLDLTRGWAAGLKLAALGLRDAAVDTEVFVDAFGGADRAVRSYLVDEVLDPLDRELRWFLVRTAVLDRMSPSLCVALTGVQNSQALLESIERRGLFVRRMTASGEWFEHHPMFRDVLRRELRTVEPQIEEELLGRAAAWYGARGEIIPAARYLIEAQRWDALLEHAERHGRALLERGDGETVVRWLDAIPSGGHPGSLRLQVRRAYLLATTGDRYRAEDALRALARADRSSATNAMVAVLRATTVDAGASPEEAIDAADQAMHALDAVEPAAVPNVFGVTDHTTLRVMVANAQARALWYLGDVDASRQLLMTASRLRGYTPWLVQAKGTLALIEAWEGDLRVARQRALDAVVLAARTGLRRHPATVDARVAMAHVARERGRLHTATRLLDEADTLAGRHRHGALRTLVVVERGLVDLAQGASEHGLAEIQRLRAEGDYAASAGLERRLRAVESRLLVAAGHPGRARRCLDVDEHDSLPDELAPAAIEAAVADRDLTLARQFLDRWTVTRRSRARLERELWASVLDAEDGDRRSAVRRVVGVLAEAREEGHERLFLDPGRPVERVLRLVGHASPRSTFVRHLVESSQPANPAAVRASSLVLSDREREIARFLPTPLTSTEIAAQLYISLNTLKTHLRSIYRKLGVQSRDAASKRAQELGLA